MPTVEEVSIALSNDMASVLKAAVASGEYASASEVVREALQIWKFNRNVEKLELTEIQKLVREGVQSGPGIESELVFSRLRAKYAAMLPPDKP